MIITNFTRQVTILHQKKCFVNRIKKIIKIILQKNFFFIGSTALEPWPLFRFPDLFTGGMTPWTSDQLVARPLPEHTTTQTQKNTYTHHLTSMPKAGFEPAITASERSKTVHASECSATATGICFFRTRKVVRSLIIPY
jgi:hypothetical protein